MQHSRYHMSGSRREQTKEEIDVMLQAKPNSVKLHEDGERARGRQGAAFAEAVSETSRATPEETTRVLEKTYSIVATGAADFHHQWIEIVRYNTNSMPDFVGQLFSVKSPAELLELSCQFASLLPAMSCVGRDLTGYRVAFTARRRLGRLSVFGTGFRIACE
jgi:hypothetical protein